MLEVRIAELERRVAFLEKFIEAAIIRAHAYTYVVQDMSIQALAGVGAGVERREKLIQEAEQAWKDDEGEITKMLLMQVKEEAEAMLLDELSSLPSV